ncbi:hypothetical protein F4679DRAFT_200422 [Xylaria curta]|nr:hypothetical protein F4679DRAFT_200422 [Xylaria curta]
MHGYRKFCNKIYQATKYVLGKLGNDFVPRDSGALTGKESLPERWIMTKMNTAAKQINQALEEREFAKSTQISYRLLYNELFDIYVENSKSILSDGTPEEARSAKDTLYTTLESGLQLMSPFMPFLTEELWQCLPRRPGDNTCSVSIAEYPEFEDSHVYIACDNSHGAKLVVERAHSVCVLLGTSYFTSKYRFWQPMLS